MPLPPLAASHALVGAAASGTTPRRLLVVKLSALGDQIFMLAAVTDAQRRWPGIVIDWVVDERFVAIPRMHPGVSEIFTVPLRRWRAAPTRAAHWRELIALLRRLRRSRYDLVVDGQGMWKSLLMTRLARAADTVTHAPSDCGEAPVARFYRRRCQPVPELHGAARLRALMAYAIGSDDSRAPDYSLGAVPLPPDSPTPPPAWALLQPHASRPHKRWHQEEWVALGQELVRRGLTPVFPWGNDAEQAESAALVAAIGPGAQLAPKLDITQWTAWLGSARLAVSTDTGLGHIASACGVPTLMLFRTGPAAVFAPARPERSAALGGDGSWPTRAEVFATLDTALADNAANAAPEAAPVRAAAPAV